jgi:hypothetical protein
VRPQIRGEVGPEHGGLISDFVSNVFVNILTALSAQDCEQVGQLVYFCFGSRNVKKGPGSCTVRSVQYE